MITRIGEVALSDVVPLLQTMLTALNGARAFAVPELQGKLAGLANILAAITVAPPSIGATIQGAIATVASLQASISAPVVTLHAAAIVALLASLNLQLAALTVTISVPDAVVSAYVYDGPSLAVGGELQSAISGTLPGVGIGDHMNALILATTSRPAWVAVGQMFRVST